MVTAAPSARRPRATAGPGAARPTTPTTSLMRLSLHDPRDVAHEVQEVGVEETDAERHARPGEQPEADGDGGLRPPSDLEVVMDGRHAQHAPFEPAVRDDLREHRQRL